MIGPEATPDVTASPRRGLGRLIAWLLRPTPSPTGYVLKMWPVQVLPSVLFIMAVREIVIRAGHPELFAHRPSYLSHSFTRLFVEIVLIGPAIETLMMIPIFWVLKHVFSGKTVQVMASAVIWAALHATANPMHGIGVLWGFVVLSAAFLAWRESSLGLAYRVTFCLHGLNNLVLVAALSAFRRSVF